MEVVERIGKRPGPPRLVIPQELCDLLDQTYETKKGFTVDLDGESENDVSQFVSALKLYAKRLDKTVRISWDSDTVIRFGMTDKRSYRKSTFDREN